MVLSTTFFSIPSGLTVNLELGWQPTKLWYLPVFTVQVLRSQLPSFWFLCAGDLNSSCYTLKQAFTPIEQPLQTRIPVSLLVVICQSNIYAVMYPDGPVLRQWRAVTSKRRIPVEFSREKSNSTDLRPLLDSQTTSFFCLQWTHGFEQSPHQEPTSSSQCRIFLISKQPSLSTAHLNLDSCVSPAPCANPTGLPCQFQWMWIYFGLSHTLAREFIPVCFV